MLFESVTTRVRKSQSLTGLMGAALHCSMIGLKFGVSPVHETVMVAPSVSPVLGLAVTEPSAPPVWTKNRLGTSSARPARHSNAEARVQRRRTCALRWVLRRDRLALTCGFVLSLMPPG